MPNNETWEKKMIESIEDILDNDYHSSKLPFSASFKDFTYIAERLLPLFREQLTLARREEREKANSKLRKYEFSYVISSDEIKHSGGPERLSERKEAYERNLFCQLGEKIREDKMYSQGHPKAPNPLDLMKTVTVLVYNPFPHLHYP